MVHLHQDRDRGSIPLGDGRKGLSRSNPVLAPRGTPRLDEPVEGIEEDGLASWGEIEEIALLGGSDEPIEFGIPVPQLLRTEPHRLCEQPEIRLLRKGHLIKLPRLLAGALEAVRFGVLAKA